MIEVNGNDPRAYFSRLQGAELHRAQERLIAALARRPTLLPLIARTRITRRSFPPPWRSAFDVIKEGGERIRAIVAANDPNQQELVRLYRMGIELTGGQAGNLAAQIMVSVRAEQTTAEVAETASRSSRVVEPEDGHRAEPKVIDVSVDARPTAKTELLTAAEATTARVGAVQPDGQRRGIATKEPKLVPPTAPRSRTPAGKLAEAMRFLRAELQGEVEATVIETRARRAGIAIKTLKRARAKLGIVSRRDGFGAAGKFYLSLPGDHSGPTGA
jgi:hypothetical protein